MAKTNGARHVIVGTTSYGLYFGLTADSDEAIVKEKAIRLQECRHIRYWYGKTGGITSLAAHGPCGPRAKQSRIGGPAPSALITSVSNVFDCSAEAVAAFARIEVSDG